MSNAIEQLGSLLQRIPAADRWLWGQQSAIIATALGIPVPRGTWGRRADKLIALSHRVGMATFVAQFVCFLLVLYLGLSQGKATSPMREGELLFVGKNASSDPRLSKIFEREQEKSARVVNEENLATFSAIQTVGLFSLFAEWWRVVRGLRSRLSQADSQPFPLAQCLTGLMSFGPKYVYLLAWFKSYLRGGGETVVGFTSASPAVAYPAVAAGARAVYLPHGFLSYSIVFPDFSEIWSDNRWEAEFVRDRLPHARVKVIAEPLRMLQSRPVVAIVGVCTEEDDLEQCRSFIEWALDRGWRLLVRPHPLDWTNYWERWKSVPGLTVLNESIDFEAFLEKYRPRLLATWHSTTIFDGIRRGIVPISWSEDGMNVEDTVFPFEKLSLHWPGDAETVVRMFEDEKMRSEFATEKYAEAIGSDRRREGAERRLPETIYR